MNKFFTKIATFSVGLLMAIGVGVGIASNGGANEARAAETTVSVTISDYATSNNWSSGTKYTSVSLDSNVTATCPSGKTYTGTYNAGWRIYATDSGSITVSTSNGTLSSVTFTYTINNSGCLHDESKKSSVTPAYRSGTAIEVSGSSFTAYVSNTNSKTNGQVYISAISVTYSTESGGGSTDTAASVTGNSSVNVGTQWSGSVTEDVGGATVSGVTYAFALSNGATLSASDTANGTFTASHAGTVTVSATLSGYSISSLTVTVNKVYDYTTTLDVVSLDDAYTATPASGDSDSMMVVGHIKSMDTSSTQHGNGYLEHTSSTRTLRIYGMYDVDGNKGTSMSNPTVPVADDVVVLEGVFCFYNSTWEIKNAVLRQKNGTVYNYPASVSSIAVKTAPTKVTYDAGEYFAPVGLVITVTYSDESTEDVAYSGHETDFTFSPSTSTTLSTSDKTVTITYGGKTTSQAITVNAVPAVLSVTVSPSTGSVNIGSTTTLTAAVEVEGGAAQTVSWSSSSDAIATVANGVVTGVTAGEVTITATSTVDNTKSGSATITVVDPTDTKIGTYTLVKDASLLNDGDWIVITNIDATYGMGEQGSNKFRSQVALTLSGSDIVISNTLNTGLKAAKLSVKNNHFEIKTDEGYLYASSGSSNDVGSRPTNSDANGEWVFSINSSTGDADCTAQGTNGRNILRYNATNTRFSCYASTTTTMAKIHIYKKLPATVAVSLTSDKELLTSVGDTATLTAKAYSDSGKTEEITGLTNADFSFESGDTDILTVDTSGVVTAVATGETTITVSRNECEASVTIKVVYITIDLINSGTSIEAGSEGTFTFTWSSNSLKPSSYDVEWSSNNDDAFAVETNGSYLAGDKDKSATITVTVVDDNLNEYVATKVFSTVSSVVAPTHISVTESSGVIAYTGTNVSLHISVLGAGDVPATNQNVVCTSSDTSVFTVTNAGVITPKSRGVATVTIVDEANLCDAVVINVRVRNAVLGAASVIGTFDFTDYTVTGKTMADWYTAGTSNYSSAEFTGGYQSADGGYIRFGSSSAVGAITVSYSDAIVKKVVVSAKLYGSDDQDCGIEGAASSGSFNSEDFADITYTFSSAVDEFTFATNASKKRLYVKSITIYTEQEDISAGANAQALYGFEELNMHLDDYTSSLGYCSDEKNHYYLTAKTAFNSLDKDLREMYATNAAFAEGWARLQAWARANGETLDANYSLSSARVMPIFAINDSNNTTAIVIVVSMVSLLSLGGYFYLKKRKED